MSDRTIRRRPGLEGFLVLGLMLAPASAVQAHGGGGHGGGGHGGGGHGSGGHSTPAVRHSVGHGGGGGTGSSGRAPSASNWDAPVLNPYDLPEARLHRYFQHLFHLDRPAHP